MKALILLGYFTDNNVLFILYVSFINYLCKYMKLLTKYIKKDVNYKKIKFRLQSGE